MKHSLSALLGSLPHPPISVRGGDTEVRAVVTDSRQVSPGACFVAIKGLKLNGHEFIGAAVAAGATSVVYEDPTQASAIPDDVATAQVPDSRLASAALSTVFWGSPSSALLMTGVTGTNGKTTVVTLLDGLCRAAGLSSAALGTLGQSLVGVYTPTSHTTLDSVELQAALASLRDRGLTHVAMEVSAHGLTLHRTWGVKFDVVALTNVSQDHLDFYPDMDAYLEAKARLFTEYVHLAAPEKRTQAVINADDPAGRQLSQRAECPVITYGLEGAPAVSARNVSHTSAGARLELCAQGESRPVALRLLGRFNVLNALCAAGCGLALGLELDHIAEALAEAPPVPGRFETIDEGQDFGVVVDYAHTPDGLRNILASARDITGGRLICVFGCGGDRDRTKRPAMGAIAEELADLVVVTSDNPRSEEPAAIIDEILAGMPARPGAVHVEPDRRRAIDLAVSLCRPNDMLVIAGKGHEPYQILATETVHFDDREEARRALRSR